MSRFRAAGGHVGRTSMRVAAAATFVCVGSAGARPATTFQSPALDNTAFTAIVTLPAPFADGAWSFSGATAPLGFSYSVSDGTTTDAALGDLQTLGFSSRGGLLTNISITVVDTASVYDPYYGYTSFFAGSVSTQLQDASNPGIVGLDYAGHHIPVANGGPGVWTLVPTAVAPVPEPSTLALSMLGLAAIAGFRRRRPEAVRGDDAAPSVGGRRRGFAR